MKHSPTLRQIIVAVAILATVILASYLPPLWRPDDAHPVAPFAATTAICVATLAAVFRLCLNWNQREFFTGMLGLVFAMIVLLAVSLANSAAFPFPAFTFYSIAILVGIGGPWSVGIAIGTLARNRFHHGPDA